MFDKRHEFDAKVVGTDPFVFASEYAVTGGGGNGNLIVRHTTLTAAILRELGSGKAGAHRRGSTI